MLTARGWWLLFAATLIAGITVTGAWSVPVAIISLTILAAFAIEWMKFAIRIRTALPHLNAERVITQGERTVTSGWAGVTFRVRLTLTNRGRFKLPLVFARDRVSLQEFDKDPGPIWNAVLLPKSPVSFEYELKSQHPGVMKFAGVSITVTDLAGFFAVRVFLPLPMSVAVLPKLTDDRGRQRANKRFNTLPPPGLHRLRRPGGGSELLDLRDYRPGDPPKMIAWKPSARRDRLITREFESEVPIRCLLFLDASNTVRVASDLVSPLALMSSTAAGVLQAATSNRDLVGLTVFDEATATVKPPGRTSSHTIGLLHDLALAAGRLPDVPRTNPDELIPLLERVMRERVPEAFVAANASHPWGMYWRPLLDRRWGWLIFLPFLLTPFLVTQPFWLELAARAARTANPNTGWVIPNLAAFLVAFSAMLMLPSTLASLFWLGHGLIGFLPGNRRRERRRKTVSLILAHADGGSPALIERFCKDDVAFAARAGKWLAIEGIRIPTSPLEHAGQSHLKYADKLTILSRSMMRAISRARDNELFVIFADLIELSDNLDVLTRAVKLARSRHHQVMVIVPGIAGDISSTSKTKTARKSLSLIVSVRRAIRHGQQRKYEFLRRELMRAGAVVVRQSETDTVRLVLDHLDRLRGARSLR